MSFNSNLNKQSFGAHKVVVKTEKCDDAQKRTHPSSKPSNAVKRNAETDEATGSGEQRPGPSKRPRRLSTSALSSAQPPSRIATPASKSAVASAEQLSKKLAAVKRALSMPPENKRKTPDRGHAKRAKSVGPKKQAYQFEPEIPANCEPLTPDEKAELRNKIDDFGYYGILDMTSILYKHEQGIIIKAYKSEALLNVFDNLQPVTLREIAAYIDVTPNKRKRRPRNAAALRAPSNPPVSHERSASVVGHSRAKSVTRGKKPAYYFYANDPLNQIPLSDEEKAALRRKVYEFSYHGIIDMSKIIHTHETTIRLTEISTDQLLSIFQDLKTVTLREIAAYVQATPPPTKRKPKFRNPQNQVAPAPQRVEVTAPQRVVERPNVEPTPIRNPTVQRQADAQPSTVSRALLDDLMLSDSDDSMSDSGAKSGGPADKQRQADAQPSTVSRALLDDLMLSDSDDSMSDSGAKAGGAADKQRQADAQLPTISRALLDDLMLSDSDDSMSDSGAKSSGPAVSLSNAFDDVILSSDSDDVLSNAPVPTARGPTPPPNETAAPTVPPKPVSKPSVSRAVTPSAQQAAQNRDRAPSKPRSRKPAAEPYVFDPEDPRNHEDMTGPERDALCRNINEFMKSGVDDMIKIIGKYDKELQPMLVNAKSIICYFQMIKTVTLRELEAYMDATPNKRKLKFRNKAIEEAGPLSTNSRALSTPPDRKTNVENQNRAKSVGPPMKPCCQCGANHASDEHPLNSVEMKYVRDAVVQYGRDGILDMMKIVQKHELHIPVMRPTSEALLQHLEKLRPKTLRKIAEYTFDTLNKRIVPEPCIVQPENFFIAPEADAPTLSYDFPMDDGIESLETSVPLASDLPKSRPPVVKDANPTPDEPVQPENFYVMSDADEPTNPYDFPMHDVIESLESAIPLASESSEEEPIPERQFAKPVYEFDLDDCRSFAAMTYEQKHMLAWKVGQLCPHGKNDLIEIADKHEGHQGAKERLIDFNQLQSVTLREIEAYFNAMPDDWKSKCERELAKAIKSQRKSNRRSERHYLSESSSSDSESSADGSSNSNSSHGSDGSDASSSSESDAESEADMATPALSLAPLPSSSCPAETTTKTVMSARSRAPWDMDVEVPPFSETYFEDDF